MKNYDVHVPHLEPKYVFAGANAGQITGWGHKFLNIEALHAITLGEHAINFIIDSADTFVHPDLVGNACNELGANFTDEASGDHAGHGTAVAGVICMVDNAFGGKGAAPRAKVVPVKALTKNGGTYDWVEEAIYHSERVELKGELKGKQRILNLSLSGRSYSAKVHEAIKYVMSRGCIVVCSAGNYGVVLGQESIGFPASIEEVLAIGATGKKGDPAVFSSNGIRLDFGLPGVDVYTCKTPDEYAGYDGTSFSGPYMCALISLIVSALPEINNQKKITDYLVSMAVDTYIDGFDDRTGHGTIDCILIAEDIIRRRAGAPTPLLNQKEIEMNLLRKVFPEQSDMKKLKEPQLLVIGNVVGAATDAALRRGENRDLIGAVLYKD